jgi:hypothetical protein
MEIPEKCLENVSPLAPGRLNMRTQSNAPPVLLKVAAITCESAIARKLPDSAHSIAKENNLVFEGAQHQIHA